MNDFDKKLDFDSNTFENMKHDMNFVLQRLLGNMIEKQSNEGSMTIKIDVTMVKEFIPNYDPNIKGESREISKPQFKHKVTSAVKITDEKGGNLNNEMEMVMDEETGCYVLQPIANTQQRTIFDSDFMQGQKQEGERTTDDRTIDQRRKQQAEQSQPPEPETAAGSDGNDEGEEIPDNVVEAAKRRLGRSGTNGNKVHTAKANTQGKDTGQSRSPT